MKVVGSKLAYYSCAQEYWAIYSGLKRAKTKNIEKKKKLADCYRNHKKKAAVFILARLLSFI